MNNINWGKILLGRYGDLSNEEKLINYRIVIGIVIFGSSILFIFPYDKLIITALNTNINEGRYVVASRIVKLLLVVLSSVYYKRVGGIRDKLVDDLPRTEPPVAREYNDSGLNRNLGFKGFLSTLLIILLFFIMTIAYVVYTKH